MDELGIYLQCFKVSLQAKLEYRTDFVIGVLTSIMMQGAALSLLWIVLGAVPTLAGWSPPQVLFLFGMTAACLGGSELFFNQIWSLPMAIVQGELDRLLTYPVRALPFYLITRPELHAFGNLLTGFAYVTTSLVWLDAGPLAWLGVPLFWVSGVVLYTSVLVCFACLSFRFLGPHLSSMMVPHNLLQATRYPLGAYPRWAQVLLLGLLPFGSFHYLPASVLFGKSVPLIALGAAPVAAGAAAWVAQRAWRWGLGRYESSGS